MVGDLTAFADTTPFRLPGVLDSANQLLSVGNVAKGDVIPTLRMLGDVAAGTGKPESLPQLASLYSTMAAQGKIQAQDIMQWTQRGIPLWGSLASVMGVAQSEMRGLVEKGQVGFPQLSAALASLTGEGGKWHGLTEKLGGTTGGMFSTLQDTFDGLTQKFASALLPAMNIKDGTGGLTGILGALGPHAERVGSLVGGGLLSAFNTLKPVVMDLAATAWPALLGIWKDAYVALSPLLPQVMALGGPAMNLFKSAIADAIPFAQGGISMLKGAADIILPVLVPAMNILTAALRTVGSAARRGRRSTCIRTSATPP